MRLIGEEHSLFADSAYDSAEHFIFFPIFLMGIFSTGTQSPDSKTASNTTGDLHPLFRLQDGDLSLSVYAKEFQSGFDYTFIVPERTYKGKDGKPVSTSTLHVDDLLAMTSLLTQCHIRLRTKLEIAKQE